MNALNNMKKQDVACALDEQSFAASSVMRDFYSQNEAVKSIAVAVSGGPDSMALCGLLSDWARQHDITVHALTVDHGLRAEAAAEAAQVGQWLSRYNNVQHKVLTRDSSAIHTARIQEDARKDRYDLMARYCAEHNLAHLFLAHHAGDQVETILFRMAKGSGLDGLRGMRAQSRYNENINLIRPLLDFSKDDLIEYCAEHNVEHVVDPSNKNEDFARVRLRRSYDVLAAEGLTEKRLSTMGKRMQRASEALDFYADQIFTELSRRDGTDRMVLPCQTFIDLPAEIRLRVMKRVMIALSKERYDGANGYGPRIEKFEKLVEDLSENPDYSDRTLAGFIVRKSKKNDTIVIEKEF